MYTFLQPKQARFETQSDSTQQRIFFKLYVQNPHVVPFNGTHIFVHSWNHASKFHEHSVMSAWPCECDLWNVLSSTHCGRVNRLFCCTCDRVRLTPESYIYQEATWELGQLPLWPTLSPPGGAGGDGGGGGAGTNATGQNVMFIAAYSTQLQFQEQFLTTGPTIVPGTHIL